MPHLNHSFILQQGKTIQIEVDGESVAAVEGESVAAALTASGRLKLNHDKNGHARGLFCGMGVCFDCLIGIDNGPSQRACLTKVHAGMRVQTGAYLAKSFQNRNTISTPLPIVESCDVLIVGTGPAGMAAAASLTTVGILPIIIDERSSPGGQFYKQLAPSYRFIPPTQADQQYRQGTALIKQVENSGAKLLNGVKVWGAFRNNEKELEVAASDGERNYIFHPQQLIIATGAFEPVPLFPGWTLPGVMTTGAAQGLLRTYRVSPGDRVLIAGNGPLNLQLACELAAAGVNIVAVAESAPAPFPVQWRAILGALCSSPSLIARGLVMLQRLRRYKIPYLNGHIIYRAEGDQQVNQATIIPFDGKNLAVNRQKVFDIDALCLGYGFQPVNDLARTLGCEHHLLPTGKMVPQRNEQGQTSIEGVFVIGDSGTIGGAQVALAEGQIAAQAVLNNLDSNCSTQNNEKKRKLDRQRHFQQHLWALYQAPEVGMLLADEQTLICRCESVTFATLKSLIKEGIHDPGTLKRISRAGMGRCQGRYCQTHLSNLLLDMIGKRPAYTSLFAPQVPIKPTVIGDLAVEEAEWSGYRAVDIGSSPPFTFSSDETLTTTDVLIIGAGILGIATAYFLAQQSIDVVIVDRGQPNSQASGSNAGSMHLQLLSFDFIQSKNTGPSPAEYTLALQKQGMLAWLELERELRVNFELKVTGGIMVAETEQDMKFLADKAKAEHRQGIRIEILGKQELAEIAPTISDRMVGGAYCADEGKINPLLATPALLKAAQQQGANLIPNTEVIRIDSEQGGYTVTTNKGKIYCKRIVNAAGGWSAQIAAMVGLSLPVQSAPQQMIVTEPAEPLIDFLVAHAHRHLTMKQASNGNIIIGGGWFATYDSNARRPVTLRESIQGNLWVAQRVIPAISQLNILRSWAAIGVMIDGAPILGAVPGQNGFFNAVGANGYTMAPMIGQIIAEEITSGKSSTQQKPFSIERFH